MNWRCLRLARAAMAAGLLGGSLITGAGLARAQDAEPADPVPGPEFQAEAVDLLRARDAGLVGVELRGAGEEAVRVALHNASPRRLRVVLPPGLVASSATGQFQSMGLGLPSNRPNSFGAFQPAGPGPESGAFRSVAPTPDADDAITLAPGRSVEFAVPAVCLNFGIPEPGPADPLLLMDVSDYTPDVRAQRALRSLATLGTSRNVAQAVAWSVFNHVPFPTMTARAPKSVNRLEGAVAARFLEALDQSTGDVVDPAYLTEARLFVRVQGDDDLADEAASLADHLDGAYILGLPTRVVSTPGDPVASGPALYLVVTLTSSGGSTTAGRVAVKGLDRDGRWNDGGIAKLAVDVPASSLDSTLLARAVDRAVARQFVSVKKLRRIDGGTLVQVENRLPMTLARVVLEANGDPAASLTFDGLGASPLRAAQVKVPAADAAIARVELNGL